MSLPAIEVVYQFAHLPRVFLTNRLFSGTRGEPCVTALTDVDFAMQLAEEHDFYMAGVPGSSCLRWLASGRRDYWMADGRPVMDESYPMPQEAEGFLILGPEGGTSWGREWFDEMAEYGLALEYQSIFLSGQQRSEYAFVLEHPHYYHRAGTALQAWTCRTWAKEAGVDHLELIEGDLLFEGGAQSGLALNPDCSATTLHFDGEFCASFRNYPQSRFHQSAVKVVVDQEAGVIRVLPNSEP